MLGRTHECALFLNKPMDTKPLSLSHRTWVRLRRTSQILFFLLFIFLFLKAEYAGQDTLPWPADLFFRFDPLILASHLLTFTPFVAALL